MTHIEFSDQFEQTKYEKRKRRRNIAFQIIISATLIYIFLNIAFK